MRYRHVLAALCLWASFTAQPAVALIPPDDHYLCDFPERLEIYRDFRWYPHELPIQVYLPPVPAGTPNAAMYAELVKTAFQNWSTQVPVFRFVFSDQVQGSRISIQWTEFFPESAEGAWGFALLPVPRYRDPQGRLNHVSKVFLALKPQPGTGMGGPNPVYFSREELLGIATHEVGHALGLPHSRNPEDLMYPAMLRFTADHQWRISPRDLATLKYLYQLPAKLEIPPCNG